MSQQNLEILQGKTFTRVLRYGKLPFVYKPISAIVAQAPVQISATAHAIPDGWLAAVVSVKGMTQINAEVGDDGQPVASAFLPVTVVDPNTVTINAINAAGFSTYTSGGYLQYYTPVSLAAPATARMTIKDAIGGTVLETLTVAGGEITLNDTYKTITLKIPAADTAAYTWQTGVYDLEFVDAAGDVTALLSGNITVTPEVTT